MTIHKILSEALPFIEKSAPVLASAFGAPGIVAGYILPIIAKAFDKDLKDTHGIVNSMLTNPNANDILQSLDKEHGPVIKNLLDTNKNHSDFEINVKIKWPAFSE